jgi:hypothetical protein
MDMIELAQRFVDSAEFQTVYGGKSTKKEREKKGTLGKRKGHSLCFVNRKTK